MKRSAIIFSTFVVIIIISILILSTVAMILYYWGDVNALKDSMSILSGLFGGLTTLGAAIIAAYLFIDWRIQENETFKRNLVYNIYNDMGDLLFMLLVNNEKYNIDDLQYKFHKINMDLLLYSKKENSIKKIISEFGCIYIKQIGIYENNKTQKIMDQAEFINKYSTVLHTVADFVGTDISSETIQFNLSKMLEILNESDATWVNEETNNILNKAIKSE